jgi:hypothetical protein
MVTTRVLAVIKLVSPPQKKKKKKKNYILSSFG